jgi:hypothetical protein
MAAQESWMQREARERQESEQGLQIACAVLDRLAVRSVEVHYDGAGDSGAIEKVLYQPEPRLGIPEGLQELLETYVYRHLPGGWEINAGSFGTVNLDVRTRQAQQDHHEREDDTEYDDFALNDEQL